MILGTFTFACLTTKPNIYEPEILNHKQTILSGLMP